MLANYNEQKLFFTYEIYFTVTNSQKFLIESLILAQNERWQRGLGMQVERDPDNSILRMSFLSESGGRVSNVWAICPQSGDNYEKL